MNTNVTDDYTSSNFVTWDSADHANITFPVETITDWITSLAQTDMCNYLNVEPNDI